MQLQADEGVSILYVHASTSACSVHVHACVCILAHYQWISRLSTGHTDFLHVFAHTCVHATLLLLRPRSPNSFSLGFTVCPMRLVPGPRWDQKE